MIISAALLAMSGPTLMADEGVVLLHGICRTERSMNRLEKELRAEGFIVVNIGYESRTASIGNLGERAIGGALEDTRLSDCAKIHFVTHSMGGLLVRSYFKQHEFDRLGRVVMLAPPNQGSELVDRMGGWWLFRSIHGPAGAEMGTAPDSTPNTLGPVGFECGVIAGDRSINWANSLMIQGRDDGKVSCARTEVQGMSDHIVIHSTHPFIMRNRTAISQTVHFLRNGSFDRPER